MTNKYDFEESIMEPSQDLINYAIASGFNESEAYSFFKKHPEFIGCEKDSDKLLELGKILEEEKLQISKGHRVDHTELYNDNFSPNHILPNSDLQGLSNDTIEELEFQGIAKQIVNKWLCQALDKNNGVMVRNACIVLQTLERKAYTDSLDISVTEDNGVYKVEVKSSYNNYEDSKVCYISKKSDGDLYVKFHEFSGLDGHLEGDSDYWGLNFALGAPSWMITSQEHEWNNVISKIINKLSSKK